MRHGRERADGERPLPEVRAAAASAPVGGTRDSRLRLNRAPPAALSLRPSLIRPAATFGSAAHGLLENVQKLLSSGAVTATISLSITSEEFTVQVRLLLSRLAHSVLRLRSAAW